MSELESLLAPGVFTTPKTGGAVPANDDVLFVMYGSGTLTESGLIAAQQSGR